ncbi:NADPH-dependent FMN reductase [Shinella sumterensis]|uniref:NADPH-dependent FMN reductase n=1 Tax=Shinella sumterensis TaxID=1967501 RepID=A0AA50H8S2_9HYPH|nr:NADPH-dependent FMN reductase [Shinella sumterensis]WLS00684.1 NADPH-dependent FMN reductase [Shinella sumterensis]
MKKIAVLVGSIRQASINRILARVIEKLAGPEWSFTYVDIGGLPHYNDDLWSSPPEGVLALKQIVEDSDAVLFVTPEFNRSIPGIVKNAIDWGSRPWGRNSWAGKPASVIGTTPGAIGTAVAQSHLRSILPVLDMVVMGQPEVYFQFKPGLVGDDLSVSDYQTRSFLEKYLERFEDWIDRIGK